MSTGEYYDRYWTEEGYLPLGNITAPLEQLYAQHVGPSADCLDLGCGDGRTSGIWLRERARSYVGVDISKPGVARARALGLDARHIETASELPFADDSFDVVVSIEVLEHLFEPHLAADEMLRVLRPGGVTIVTVPNASHWRDRIDMLCGKWIPRGDDLGREEPWRSPHIRFFSVGSLRALLQSRGFREVSVGGKTASPLSSHVPGMQRFSRTSRPSHSYLKVVDLMPSLVAPGLWAVARK